MSRFHQFAVAAVAVAGALLLADAARTEVAHAEGAFNPEESVARLRALRPDLPIQRVTSSPVDSLVAIELEGGAMLYATKDGDYLIAGDLYRITDTTLVNLAEEKRSEQRQELLAAIDPDDTVIFAPKNTRAVVNIFTDVDCTFCRKLHTEMADYNALGIEVRYLAYPRAGVGSESYDKIVSAWCSDDRQTAITALKAGKEIAEKQCVNPVAEQYQLGQTIGISGTPAIVTLDGRLLPGYMPAKALAAELGI